MQNLPTLYLVRVALCALGSIVAVACGGTPPEGAPDYEVDLTGRKTPTGEGAGQGQGAGQGAGQGQGDGDGAPPVGATDGGGLTGESTPTPDGGTLPIPNPPAPTVVTVKVQGTTLRVDKTVVWVGVSKLGTNDLFIHVSGGGLGAGSDFHVSATRTGSGCDTTANYITYRPANDTQYMPKSAKDAACGLVITSLPTATGGRFTGSFRAPLNGINLTTPRSKTIDLAFDVLHTK